MLATMKAYEILEYRDVLGNEDDGWEVQDVWNVGQTNIVSTMTDEEIATLLVERGNLDSAEDVALEWCDNYVFINEVSTARPLGALRALE